MTAANTGRRRPGRPAGSSDTRDRILASARELFARNGIDRTSIRAVAAAAGVDVGAGASLLRHQGEAVRRRRSTSRSTRWTCIGPMREVPVEEIGCRLPSMLLPLWDSEMGAGFIATLRSIPGRSRRSTCSRSFIAGRDRGRKWVRAWTIRRAAGSHPGPVRRVAVDGRGDGALHPADWSRSRRCRPSRSRRPSRRTCSATSPGICRTALSP